MVSMKFSGRVEYGLGNRLVDFDSNSDDEQDTEIYWMTLRAVYTRVGGHAVRWCSPDGGTIFCSTKASVDL